MAVTIISRYGILLYLGNQYATITHPIHYRESTVVTFTLKLKSLLAVKCHDEQKVCT